MIKMQVEVFVTCNRCSDETKVRAKVIYDHFDIIEETLEDGWVKKETEIYCNKCKD